MKKLLSIIIALALICGLAACGGEDSGSGGSRTTTTPRDTTTPAPAADDTPPADNGGAEPSSNDIAEMSDFLAKLNFSEADVIPSDAADVNYSSYVLGMDMSGAISFKSELMLDKDAKTEYFQKLLDKFRAASPDGKIYFDITGGEEFNVDSPALVNVWQYGVFGDFVTVSLFIMDGKVELSVTFTKSN